MKSSKKGLFLEVFGIYFFTLIATFVILSFVPEATEIAEDGTEKFTSLSSMIIVFLPIISAVSYRISAKKKIKKENKHNEFESIYPEEYFDTFEPDAPVIRENEKEIRPVVPICRKKETAVVPKEAQPVNPPQDIPPAMSRDQRFREMQQFQDHRIKLQKYKENIIAQKRLFDSEAKSKEEKIRAKEMALRETEFTIIDWVSRMENKDREIFDEMLRDAEKLKENFIQIDGYEFEEYVAKLLRINGYENVQVTKKSNDYGADVLAEKAGIRYVFQCKYYTSMVGISAVQQIYSAKDYYDAHIAVVVTNNVFTKAAKKLAQELKVILWDCEMVNKLAKAEQGVNKCQEERPLN